MPYSGHFGQKKTIDLIRRYFWWPNMNKDIAEYVKSCDICQRVKYSRERPAGLLQPLAIPDEPWSSVSMDFIVELPRSYSGHDAILVFVDRLTKMVRAAPNTMIVSAAGAATLLGRYPVDCGSRRYRLMGRSFR